MFLTRVAYRAGRFRLYGSPFWQRRSNDQTLRINIIVDVVEFLKVVLYLKNMVSNPVENINDLQCHECQNRQQWHDRHLELSVHRFPPYGIYYTYH